MTTAAAPAAGRAKQLEAVPHVELDRYLGTWFEIATIPQRFQKGCVGVTAEYSLRPDGDVQVVNTCHEGTLDGNVKRVVGKAWVVDKTTSAKLRVRFFWPFSGSYWIIGLAPDYTWAVVGHPNRKYLWILCRSPQMDAALYQELLTLVADQGYDLTKIEKTLQPGGETPVA